MPTQRAPSNVWWKELNLAHLLLHSNAASLCMPSDSWICNSNWIVFNVSPVSATTRPHHRSPSRYRRPTHYSPICYPKPLLAASLQKGHTTLALNVNCELPQSSNVDLIARILGWSIVFGQMWNNSWLSVKDMQKYVGDLFTHTNTRRNPH